MNFYRELERINDRIDITDPSTADLLAIAEACRYRSVDHAADGTPVPTCEPKAHNHFFANHGTKRIKLMTEDYAASYTGSFPFMVAMRGVVRQRGYLTMKQAAGVLNVMLAAATRTANRTGDLPASLTRAA